MKNSLIRTRSIAAMAAFASTISLGAAGMAYGASADDARAIRDGIYRAKSVVDRALSQTPRSEPSSPDTRGPGHRTPGPGPSPWDLNMDEITENDFVALPIYADASNSLFKAGSLADQAAFALTGVNIPDGVFKFVQSCATMGIARSQVARANLAASLPPVGYLAAFGPELEEVVVELNALHQRCE